MYTCTTSSLVWYTDILVYRVSGKEH